MEAVKYEVSEIKVVYQPLIRSQERPLVNSSSDAFVYILNGYDRDTIGIQEQFVVMYMNVANRILGVYRAGVGGITGTVADVRLILSVALKLGATSMIISHNHPSGNLKPSRQDEELTRKLVEAGKVMDVKILDHLIIEPSGDHYYSFADEGLL